MPLVYVLFLSWLTWSWLWRISHSRHDTMLHALHIMLFFIEYLHAHMSPALRLYLRENRFGYHFVWKWQYLVHNHMPALPEICCTPKYCAFLLLLWVFIINFCYLLRLFIWCSLWNRPRGKRSHLCATSGVEAKHAPNSPEGIGIRRLAFINE